MRLKHGVLYSILSALLLTGCAGLTRHEKAISGLKYDVDQLQKMHLSHSRRMDKLDDADNILADACDGLGEKINLIIGRLRALEEFKAAHDKRWPPPIHLKSNKPVVKK